MAKYKVESDRVTYTGCEMRTSEPPRTSEMDDEDTAVVVDPESAPPKTIRSAAYTYRPERLQGQGNGYSRRRIAYIGIILIVVLVIAVAVLLWPARRAWLLWEMGPVQLVQSLVLLAAAIQALRLVLKEPADSDERPAMAAVLGLVVALFWREAEPDYLLLGYHAFSWKYLVDGSPVWIKLGLGIPSIAFTIYILRMILPRLRGTLDSAWRQRHLASPRLLVISMACLGFSQLWDKAGKTMARIGLEVFVTTDRDPLPEELFELCGELLLLYCVLEFTHEVAARRSESTLV